MTSPMSDPERKLLLCLLDWYREFGPSATAAVKGLHEEADMEVWDLEEAVKGLRTRELVEYWALQPAIRLTAEGLRVAERLFAERGPEGG